MKRANGFTLIELLGVITILSLLALVTIPVVEKNVKKGQKNANEMQIQNIKLATKNWVSDNKVDMAKYFVNCEKTDPDLPCNTKKISLKYLINEGYLDNETLKNFESEKEINLDNSYVEIIYISKKNYKYEVIIKLL